MKPITEVVDDLFCFVVGTSGAHFIKQKAKSFIEFVARYAFYRQRLDDAVQFGFSLG